MRKRLQRYRLETSFAELLRDLESTFTSALELPWEGTGITGPSPRFFRVFIDPVLYSLLLVCDGCPTAPTGRAPVLGGSAPGFTGAARGVGNLPFAPPMFLQEFFVLIEASQQSIWVEMH